MRIQLLGDADFSNKKAHYESNRAIKKTGKDKYQR